MLYKPNFCCNCGEKIERTDWNLLTSRRFCEACAAENKRYDRLPQLTIAGGLLAVMFGLGTMFGGARERPVPVQTLNAAPVPFKPGTSETKPADKVEVPQAESAAPETAVPPQGGHTVQPTAGEIKAPGKVYYCGALTKKGTPCSRKVKAAGARCFQHEGKPSTEAGG